MVELIFGSASSSLLLGGVLFQPALTPIRACRRSDSSNLINPIRVEEELEATNLERRTSRGADQVRLAGAPHVPKVVGIF